MAPGSYGLYVGGSVIVGGSLSSAVGGWLTDRLRTDTGRGWVCAFSQWLPLPFWLGALLSPTKEASLFVLFFAFLIGDAYLGVAVSMLQLTVPTHLRSRASMYYLGLNTLAGGFGPMFVGMLLQYGEMKLQVTLAAVVGVCLPLSGLFFLLGGWSSDRVARKLRGALSVTSLGQPMGPPQHLRACIQPLRWATTTLTASSHSPNEVSRPIQALT
jgi:MFS family permease